MRGLAHGFDRLLGRVDQILITVVAWIAIAAVIAIGLTVSFVLN
jgi:hypothetical protein